MPAPSEFAIQRAYIMWFCGVPGKVPAAGIPGVITWHTPNGGKRDPREAKVFKELGVLAGFPDVAHLWGALHLLELKDDKGRLSGAQIDLHPRLVAAGAKVATAHSLDEAKGHARAWKLVRDGC